MKKGVNILFSQKAGIPHWINFQTRFIDYSTRLDNAGSDKTKLVPYRNLFIKKGKARFRPSGGVEVNTPAMEKDHFVISFYPMTVFEIRDSNGSVIHRNYFLCTDCFALNGVIIGQSPGSVIWQSGVTLQCSVCEKKWTIENP